jgi:PAS domain S-box-containing protein
MEKTAAHPRALRIVAAGSVTRDLLVVMAFLVVALLLDAAFLLFYYLPLRRRETLRELRPRLMAVVGDRANSVSGWVRERKGDAAMASLLIATQTPESSQAGPLTAKSVMLFQQIVQQYRYRATFIVDRSARVVYASDAKTTLEPCAAKMAAALPASPTVDFCQGRDGTPQIVSIATIPGAGTDANQPRAVVFLSDPHEYIYPALAAWSAATRTGETVLGRDEGKTAIGLSPLRHIPTAPLMRQRPIEKTILRAMTTNEGFKSYRDYRNVPVFGLLQNVVDSPWVLFVKIDVAEAVAPAIDDTIRLGVYSGLPTILLATIAFGLLRSRRVQVMRTAEAEFRQLFENSVSGILVVQLVFDARRRPVDHRFLLGNPAFERMARVTAREEAGKTGAQMAMRWSPEILDKLYEVALTGKPYQYESYNESRGRWYDARVFSPAHGQFAYLFSDITDRKIAEAVLAATQLRYQTLSDSSPLGVYALEEGVLSYINTAAAAMIGYTPDELIGTDPFLIAVPEDVDWVRDRMQRRIEGGNPETNLAFRARCKDGSVRWLQLFGARIVIEERVTLMGNIIDITERRQAESALRESEEQFRRIVETASEGIWVSDADGLTTYVNRKLAEMLGTDPENVMGRPATDFIAPDEIPDFEQRLANRRREPAAAATYERHLRRTDGSIWDALVSVVPVHGEHGEFDGTFAMLTDITERNANDRQLRRLGTAIEQLAEGIVIVDRRRSIQYVNPAFEKLTGLSSTAVLGRAWPLLETTADDTNRDALLQALRNGEPWAGIIKNIRRDGTIFDEETVVSPVRNMEGEIINFVAIKRDVTREIALAAQLHQAQKMEAVGTLAGGVAHDFNNLLQGMLMWLQVLARRYELPEKGAEIVADLEKLSRRGMALTRQLLIFSRKEVAKPELLDFNDVVRNASSLLRHLVKENIAFAIELSEEILPVTVDRSQMEQVLVNLVVNASDAMPNGGRLRIVSGREPGGRPWLSVEDNGHGIPAQIRARVFEPFFTTKGRDKGTGLGLSVVHGIVTEHEGTVKIHDPEAGGTRFVISLPRGGVGSGHLATVETAAQPVPSGRGERVLVIEDEEAVRKGLVAMLEMLEYLPTVVSSGEEALTLPLEPHFAVTLSDVVLPGVAGFDVTRQLSERWPAMKTILMSGYSSDQGLRERVENGSITLLEKPFDISVLATALRGALEEH